MNKKALGKIEKPSVDAYKGKRKVYLIPLLVSGKAEDLPQDWNNKLGKYWKQVEARLRQLELKVGVVRKVYCELVDKDGATGNEFVKKMDKMVWQVIESALGRGAELKGVENSTLLQEYFDWLKCLYVNLTSERVNRLIADFFAQNLKQRYEHISMFVNDDLKTGEAAALFVRDSNSIKLAQDIDLFRILPPALDELYHYLEKS